MAKRCKTPEHEYHHEGRGGWESSRVLRVRCELPPGHDGPHAAWTFERAPFPRVEWSDGDAEWVPFGKGSIEIPPELRSPGGGGA